MNDNNMIYDGPSLKVAVRVIAKYFTYNDMKYSKL